MNYIAIVAINISDHEAAYVEQRYCYDFLGCPTYGPEFFNFLWDRTSQNLARNAVTPRHTGPTYIACSYIYELLLYDHVLLIN